MGALGDECVERCNTAFLEEFGCDRKKKMRVIVAGLVGNDGEDSFARLNDVERFTNYGSQCACTEVALCRTLSNHTRCKQFC